MTRDFAMVAYSNEGAPLKINSTITTPMFASTPPPFRGTWRIRHPPYTNDGPQQCSPSSRARGIELPSSQSGDAGSIPTESNQCVFIRYYTMRFRIFPKVIRAGAGPHDLGSGDNRGDAFPELVVRSNAELTMGDEDLREWGPTTDATGSDPGIVVRNTPYVWLLPYHFVSADSCLQDEEYDSWDTIADYVFQVIPFPVPVPGHSTLSMEEFQCYIRVDAPSRPCGDSYSGSSTDNELQSLILG